MADHKLQNLLDMARGAWAKGNHGKAFQYAEKSFRQTGAPEDLEILSSAALKLGKSRQIIKALQSHCAISPTLWLNFADALLTNEFGESEINHLRDCFPPALSRHIYYHKQGELWVHLAKKPYSIEAFEQALSCFKQALELAPDFIPSLHNGAFAAVRSGQYDLAVEWSKKALAATHSPAVALNLSANLSARTPDLDREALTVLSRFIEEDPACDTSQSLRWNRAFNHLRLGNYLEGWKDYRCRTQRPHDNTQIPEGPEWNGEALEKPLLIYVEQGFGDALQYARFIERAKHLAQNEVILYCQKQLTRLMNGVAGVDKVIAHTPKIREYAAKVSIMDLPNILKTGSEDLWDGAYIKQPVPLLALPELSAHKGPKIGIVWEGNAHPDPLRTCGIEYFEKLAQKAGITLFGVMGFHALPTGYSHPHIIDLAPRIGDFLEQADSLARLDLLISIDTVHVHLAGAMGVPTWALLPYRSDWRWEFNERTNWYPDMRLFRQQGFNDWPGVFANVELALASFLKSWKQSETD